MKQDTANSTNSLSRSFQKLGDSFLGLLTMKFKSKIFWGFPFYLGIFALISPANSQIAPDGSLSTNVTSPDNVNFTINDGNRAGNNLFHSFREFSVPTNGSAFFNNAADIRNIFSRVTGGSISNIDGLIRANGVANLFLLNPNGIIFGPNARLNIGGSFFASTANSLIFSDGTVFSTTPSQTAPLLTINVPIGLQYGGNSGQIRVQGSGQDFGLDGIVNSFDSSLGGLQVSTGQTLALAGGNVIVEGGILQAPGGRVELGGLAAPGTIQLNLDNGSLTFPEGIARADVSLTNRAGVNVIADSNGGGSIALNAQNIRITGESLLTSGIASNLGEINTRSGDITLNATGATTIETSRIENNVNSGTIADSGNINIATGAFSLTDGAILNTTNFESGFAGDITINARDQVSVTNESSIASDGAFGRIFISSLNSSVEIANSSITTESYDDNTDPGQFSEIRITAPSGSIFLNQATISTSNYQSGFAGDIILNARDTIEISQSLIASDGEQGRILIGQSDISGETSSPRVFKLDSSTLTTTNASSQSAEDIPINAGEISISAIENVSLVDSTVAALTGRLGDAGNVTVKSNGNVEIIGSKVRSDIFNNVIGEGNAGNISISAPGFVNIFNSEITSEVLSPDATGFGGNITINGGSIFINQNSFTRLETTTQGSGDAGNIALNAQDNISIIRSFISSNTFGAGNAGTITVTANNGLVDIVGSSINSQVNSGASGSGGTIYIDGGAVALDLAELQTSTFDGSKNAGNIIISARDAVTITGSNIFSKADYAAQGDAGFISIEAGTISISGDTRIDSSNFVGGNAGFLEFEAKDNLSIVNSTVTSDAFNQSTQASGKFAGYMTFTAGNLLSIANSTITADSFGGEEVDASDNSGFGFISINAGTVSLFNNTLLSTTTFGSGAGGDIEIKAQSVSLNDASRVESSTFGSGNAGNVRIDADGTVSVANSSIRSNAELTATGNAGNIAIASASISLSDGALLESSNFVGGNAGNVQLTAGDDISMLDSQIFSDTYQNSTQSEGGFAGNIVIKASDSFTVVASQIGAESFGGEALEADLASGLGFISVEARTVSLSNQSKLSTSTYGTADAGFISVDARDNVSLDDSLIFSNVEAGGVGTGGDIRINARSLFLNNGSQLQTLVRQADENLNQPAGRGDAGNITINVQDQVILNGTALSDTDQDGESFSSALFSTVETGAKGKAGNIEIRARFFSLNDGAQVSVTNDGDGSAGDIDVKADTIRLDNRSTITAETASGDGGNITLKARDLLVLRRNSSISTSAGRAGAGGNGGNINIVTNSLVALEDSDITANAFEGRGGRVTITAKGIFGARSQTQATPSSDITAFSQVGGPELSGTVELNTPDVDPSSGLIELPQTVVDITGLIDQRCSPTAQQSTFVITGRGGIPANPNEPLDTEGYLVDLITPDSQRQESRGTGNSNSRGSNSRLTPQTSAPSTEIVEAQGWIINEKGQVVLTAQPPTVTPQRPGLKPVECYVR